MSMSIPSIIALGSKTHENTAAQRLPYLMMIMKLADADLGDDGEDNGSGGSDDDEEEEKANGDDDE